jgi:hypothetical protein
MRHTICTLVALAIALPVHAEWTTFQAYNGTPGSDIPVGVSIRAFGPTNDVVLVVERRDGTNGPGTSHFLKLLRFQCGPPDCVGIGVYPALDVPPAPAAGLTNDQYHNASLALHGSIVSVPLPLVPGGPIRPLWSLDSAHILHRSGPTAGCSATQLDLAEEVLDFDPLSWGHFAVSANSLGQCKDRQLSYTQESGDTLFTCWTLDPTSAASDNQVWCGQRNLTGMWTAWISSLLADGANDQDHMSFVVDPATDFRYVVHRDRDASPDGIALRVPETGTAGNLAPAGGPGDELDYPSIGRAPDGSYHAVWHFPAVTGGQIHYASCPAASDCTVAANWSPSVQIRTASRARHAEIAISSEGRMMVTWMEGSPRGDRVHFKETCVGSGWPPGGGDRPRPLSNVTVDQSTFMGRPHITIDEELDLVHLAFVEWDTAANPGSGTVQWSRKAIATCP